MRKLVLLRGVPCSGKSTFIKEHNLTEYTICPDNIRLLFQSPILDINGNLTISQRNEKHVWNFLFQILEKRMSRGEFTIIDATHSRNKLVSPYKKLAEKYRYRIYMIDFSSVSIETILSRNKKRKISTVKYIDPEKLKLIYERLKIQTIPNYVKKIDYKDTNKILDEIFNVKYNFKNKYNKVILIGDIHGCFEPLKKFFNNYKNDIYNDKTFVVFLGDYIDRGLQNREVLEFIMPLSKNNNFLFLEGNHERWLRLWAHNEIDKIKSKEFLNHTMPQIEELSKSDVREFCRRLAQMAYFDITDYLTIFANHGGISNLPAILTATNELINGTGRYNELEAVTNSFSSIIKNHIKTYKKKIIQVHGHRNIFDKPFTTNNIVYNLEGGVDIGKDLRVLIITNDNQISQIKIPNDLYRTDIKIKKINKLSKLELSNKDLTLENFKLNKDIIVKETDLKDVYSINFSRKTFRRKKWNTMTCKARGLFLSKDNKVILRAWDKFFNWGENNTVKSINLKNILVFPVTAYEKINGHLMLISFNSKHEKLFIASKTSFTSDHVTNFTNKFLNDNIIKLAKQYADYTLAFEIVDLNFDPHIIPYKNSEFITLLGIIKNTLDSKEYKEISYNILANISKNYNIKIPKIITIFTNFEDLYNYRLKFKYPTKENMSENYRYIEGVVLVDQNNFRIKLKYPQYSIWKKIRGYKQAIQRNRFNLSNNNIAAKFKTDIEPIAIKYMQELSAKNKLKNLSIVDIRNNLTN